MDDIRPRWGRARASGWCIRPDGAEIEIRLGSDRVTPKLFYRRDLEDNVIPGDGNAITAFRASLRHRLSEGTSLELVIDGVPVEGSLLRLPPTRRHGAIPPAELRTRVHGSDNLSAFLLEGYSAYLHLSALVHEYVAPANRSGIRLLDWGVGCGRVARYFACDPTVEVVGSDIDADNISWCRDNIPGRFEMLAPEPPTSFELESFDVIIGVSVMTHLDQERQLRWLEHLRTLLVPGGVAVVTTHGWGTLRRARGLTWAFDRFAAEGFIDGGSNPNLPDSVVDAGYYRNVFNTPEQIHREWSRVLDVEDIRPALIGQHQDVVVMRRPTD